eukprot:15442812-Alexandrium_andersonii.AAC.1
MASIPMAVVGTTQLCVCNERAAHVQLGVSCTGKQPGCTCVHPQPRTPCSATPMVVARIRGGAR